MVKHRILVSRIQKPFIRRAKGAVDPLQPTGETTTRALCVDIGTGTSKQVNTSLLCCFEEGLQSEDSLGPVITRLSFKQSPVRVE